MSLFQNPKPMLKWILLFVSVLVLALIVSTTTCHAAGVRLDLGYGRTVMRAPTDVASLTVVWPRQIGNIDLYAGLMLIGSYEYGVCNSLTNRKFPSNMNPEAQLRLSVPCEYSNQIVVRAGVLPHIGKFGIGLGVATMQHDDIFNSGNLQFNLRLTYEGIRHVVIGYDHFSNAGSNNPNLGRDMASIAWRFK